MRHTAAHIESEGEYFHRIDVELIDHERRQAAAEERRRRMAEALHVQDPRVLQSLETLGFSPSTISLLSLVPLIQVAWRDGAVSSRERQLLYAKAGLHGVTENTPAYSQLTGWLDRLPSPEFFEGAWQALRISLESLPAAEQEAARETIIQECTDIASTAGGFQAWTRRICHARRKLAEEIFQRLGPETPVSAPASPRH